MIIIIIIVVVVVVVVLVVVVVVVEVVVVVVVAVVVVVVVVVVVRYDIMLCYVISYHTPCPRSRHGRRLAKERPGLRGAAERPVCCSTAGCASTCLVCFISAVFYFNDARTAGGEGCEARTRTRRARTWRGQGWLSDAARAPRARGRLTDRYVGEALFLLLPLLLEIVGRLQGASKVQGSLLGPSQRFHVSTPPARTPLLEPLRVGLDTPRGPRAAA